MSDEDETVEYLRASANKLATWLGDSHGYLETLLGWMERAQGNIPPELTKLIKETRLNLTRQQDAFLKEYGDWNKPGDN